LRAEPRREVRLRVARDAAVVGQEPLHEDRAVADEDPAESGEPCGTGDVHVGDRGQQLHPLAHHAFGLRSGGGGSTLPPPT
jgi:hypothetical protein